MHRAVPALVGVLVATLLSSCTDGADAGPDGSADSSSGPATTSTAPTGTTPPTTGSSTRPPPEPPTMPALAQEKSTAGAKAFVKYYIDVLNYSWKARTARDLEELGAATCGECQAVAARISETASAGGERLGATWTVKSLHLIPLQSKSKPIVQTGIKIAAGKWRPSAEEKFRRIRPGAQGLDFRLVWKPPGWRVSQIDSVAQ